MVSHDAFFSDVYAEVFNRAEDANLGPPPTANNWYYAGIPFPEYTTYTDSLERGTTYYW